MKGQVKRMKALGLIVEYNPMHNGHLYHLNESKKLTNPDVTIAVMSGNFTQRGEPAIVNKWERAKMALENGIDLVIELPYAFSNQSANLFATGAVSILNHLKVDHLVFGSESGNIDQLWELARRTGDLEFQQRVKEKLDKGLSLPAAYQELDHRYNGSNNTLGIAYLSTIEKLNANLKPLTISRLASQHTEEIPNHPTIASATAIRKMITEGADYGAYTPCQLDPSVATLQNWESHYPYLRHKLLTTDPEDLEQIHDMVEGLEHRFIESAKSNSNFEDFVTGVKTKRYTRTRLQRICANVLTGTTKPDIAQWDLKKGASYIRILGFTGAGAQYLRQVKKEVEAPIYSTFSRTAHDMLKHEQKVTAAYASIYSETNWTNHIEKEFSGQPVQLEPQKQ